VQRSCLEGSQGRQCCFDWSDFNSHSQT